MLLILKLCFASILLLIVPSPANLQRWGPSANAFIRDTVYGSYAQNLECSMSRLVKDDWLLIGTRNTGSSGSCSFSMGSGHPVGTPYKLILRTEAYYLTKNLSSFYPYIEVVFEKQDDSSHLIPILISPFAYSAYRGHSGN